MKTASASIGAAEVSAQAVELEAAGSDIAVSHNKISATDSFAPLLRELDTALQSQKADDIDRILEELMRQPFDSETKNTLEKISDGVLMAEYDKAVEILAGLIDIP